MLRAVSCLALAGSASAFAIGGPALSVRSGARCASATMEGKGAYAYSVRDLDDKLVDLSTYEGKTSLVVNVASK